MLYVGAPTVEDASRILIEILDLRHPLTFNQPLLNLTGPREKRTSVVDPDRCPQPKQLGCPPGMLYTIFTIFLSQCA